MSFKDEEQWLLKLREYLFNTLQPIFPKEDHRIKIIDPYIKTYWSNAFTSPSISSNGNYEKLEFVGDKMLGSAFSVYLLKTFPDENEGFYTEAVAQYLSSRKQFIFTDILGLDKYLRIADGVDITAKIKTDLIESFCGALTFAADDAIAEGMGYLGIRKLIAYLFSLKDPRLDINPDDIGEASPKTAVPQWFNAFDLGVPTVKTSDYATKDGVKLAKVEIKLTDAQVNGLNGIFGTDLKTDKDGVIVSVVSKTKTGADLEAYQELFDLLVSKGINAKTVELKKIERSMLSYGELGQRAEDKAKRAGYYGIRFDASGSGKTTQTTKRIIQLVGIKNLDGRLKKDLLLSEEVSTSVYKQPLSRDRIHKKMLEDYLSK